MTLQKAGLRTITRVPYRIQKDHGPNMLLFNELWTQVTQRKNPVKYGHQGDTPWCLYYCSAKKHHEPVLYCHCEKSRQRGRRVGSISEGGDNNSSKKLKPQKERKAENNAYAKFWRGNKEHYGIFEKGLLSNGPDKKKRTKTQ